MFSNLLLEIAWKRYDPKPSVTGEHHGIINYIDAKEKCWHLKSLPVKGLCGRCISDWVPPPLLGFCLGWSSKFVGSKSGQIQSVKHTGKGGESWTREKVRGATIHKAGSKISSCLTASPLQSINSEKHLPQSPIGHFLEVMTFCFSVYMVN
jgi:hypothetical protein